MSLVATILDGAIIDHFPYLKRSYWAALRCRVIWPMALATPPPLFAILVKGW